MSSSFTVEARTIPSFSALLARAAIGEPLQLSGAGWTGEEWPRGLFAKVTDAATVASTIELTPELEESFARAGLVGSFLAYVRGSSRGVVVSRDPSGVTFGILALSSAADYALAVRLAVALARLCSAKVRRHADTGGAPEARASVEAAGGLSPDDALVRFDATFAAEDARQVGTWLAEDIAEGRTYFFQCPHGFTRLAPEDLRDVPKDKRFARASELLRSDGTPPDVGPSDPRHDAVLLTAAMVFAAGADGRLDDEEARQLEAHFSTIRELRAFPARELFEAVKAEVPNIAALRGLASQVLRRKAFVLAGEVIASARGGNLTGDADDPNVQAINTLASALGLEADQAFLARVVTTVMAKYSAADVDEAIAKKLVLGMLLAAAADGHVDEHEAALLSALARTVPELRARDVTTLFEAAKVRMEGGVDAALHDLDALGGHENKCFALAAEVALVAGRGQAGTLLPRLREHIRPEPSYAECAIATFTAKYG